MHENETVSAEDLTPEWLVRHGWVLTLIDGSPQGSIYLKGKQALIPITQYIYDPDVTADAEGEADYEAVAGVGVRSDKLVLKSGTKIKE